MSSTPARVELRAAEMLAVARALMTPEFYSSVSATLAGPLDVQNIGPSAMSVLESTLARGVVKALARLGGARARIRPDRGSPKPARVFEVRPPPKLAFGPYTFELIRWLTNAPLGARELPQTFELEAKTLGDELCAYLALVLVEGQRLERTVAAAPGLWTPLTWLGFARSFARHGGVKPRAPASFASLLATEDARTIVECLAGDLARRWAASVVWDEEDIVIAEHAVRIGTVERATLERFLDAASDAGRWDLATFLIDAAARALPPGARPRDIAARAMPRVRTENASLRARTEARRRAGALFHALGRLGKHRDELAHVHFIDEGYDVAQATLSSWEVLGRDAFLRAESVLATLASLEDLTAPAAGE
jgi:hypothetical protein